MVKQEQRICARSLENRLSFLDQILSRCWSSQNEVAQLKFVETLCNLSIKLLHEICLLLKGREGIWVCNCAFDGEIRLRVILKSFHFSFWVSIYVTRKKNRKKAEIFLEKADYFKSYSLEKLLAHLSGVHKILMIWLADWILLSISIRIWNVIVCFFNI